MSQQRIEELKAELARIHQAQEQFIAESEGARDWTPMDGKEMAVVRELAPLVFAAEWTPDVISARKAAWNAWVIANQRGGKIESKAVGAQEDRQGWKINDLKRAIALHI